VWDYNFTGRQVSKGSVVFALGLFCIFANLGCATYQSKVTQARDYLSQNKSAEAVEYLKPLAEKESDDQLIYVFDYATALQAAGNYKESNTWFQYADKLANLKDYVSIGRQAGSLLFAQELVQYKGEDFERLFINVMGAINYLMLGDLESANVETRRLNEKLNYYRIEEKKPYEQVSFAFYLNAHIWESNRNWDSAFIDFKKAYELNPNFDYIKEDLVRSAAKAHRNEEYEKYSKQFKIKKRPEWDDKSKGELVIVYLQGWGPRKQSIGGSPSLPELVPTWNNTRSARALIYRNQQQALDRKPEATELSQNVYDVEAMAIKVLRDQYAGLVAKRVAGYVAKEATAAAVAQKNEAAGAILRFAMHASDRADLRQWSTLPQTIQIARAYLPVGKYQIELEGLNPRGVSSGESSSLIPVEIKSGKKSFALWRSWR
jgi:uncharacterized protein